MRSSLVRLSWLGAPALALLTACGGGGDAAPATPAAPEATSPGAEAAAAEPLQPDGQPAPLVETAVPESTASAVPTVAAQVADSSLTDAQRAAAAAATAQSSTNACAAIRPFYWEIGSRSARQAAGSVVAGSSSVGATTPLAIASASKWLYGTYVAQRQNGVLSDTDRKYLSMRSGYTTFGTCSKGQTVDQCVASGSNGTYTATMDGRFFYGGGHMEKHASLAGLGAMNNAGLAAELRNQLGSDLQLSYSQPQLAGGVVTSAEQYAKVLRRMLDGTLRMGALLGTGAVCTNPKACGTQKAVYAPVPPDTQWHYSVGHWVEDDPVGGDGAFSSPGAFGFYPWIDAGKTTYGIVARVQANGAWPSVRCGQLIRKAWFSGAPL